MFGYKPTVTQVANTVISFYQQLPAKLSGSVYIPDYDYALFIPSNTTIGSNLTGIPNFLVEDPVDFTVSSSQDPTEVTVYSTSGGNPTYYLLKKDRKAISATISTTTFSFGAPVQFSTVVINSPQILLGDKSATEPLLLGNKTVDLLRDVLTALQSTLNQLQVLTSLPPGAPFAPLNIQSAVANQTISKALATLETLKSPNNKTI
jgi:hypothetical protein